ncbi:hypothetical protein [Lacticaseibacillus paracasei]|uniref:hypothetical protein n=1 Tax=Lacticaseibacillus paracasei TaxID=1597 RepID=UPI00235E5D6D|nr:hypothetical protein [Lacticaseibacillus paracasei]
MNDEYERLTNDAKYLLLQLSSKYLESVTDGKSKSDATTMGSTQQVRDDVMPQWSLTDVSFTMGELRDAGFMKLWPGDNCYYNSFITTQAIAWREQKFGNDVKKVLDAIAGVKKLIPFF